MDLQNSKCLSYLTYYWLERDHSKQFCMFWASRNLGKKHYRSKKKVDT